MKHCFVTIEHIFLLINCKLRSLVININYFFFVFVSQTLNCTNLNTGTILNAIFLFFLRFTLTSIKQITSTRIFSLVCLQSYRSLFIYLPPSAAKYATERWASLDWPTYHSNASTLSP